MTHQNALTQMQTWQPSVTLSPQTASFTGTPHSLRYPENVLINLHKKASFRGETNLLQTIEKASQQASMNSTFPLRSKRLRLCYIQQFLHSRKFRDFLFEIFNLEILRIKLWLCCGSPRLTFFNTFQPEARNCLEKMKRSKGAKQEMAEPLRSTLPPRTFGHKSAIQTCG